MVLGLVAVSCAGLEQWESADGPPTFEPTLGQDPLVTIDRDTVTDRNETVGACVWTMIWAETASGPDWRQYAIDLNLLDVNGEDSEGELLICDGVDFDGPREYQIPLHELDSGWYSVCAAFGCTEPFEVP